MGLTFGKSGVEDFVLKGVEDVTHGQATRISGEHTKQDQSAADSLGSELRLII